MSQHEHGVTRPLAETTGAVELVQRRAAIFFLVWLILAATMSLAGNAGHALLVAPPETRWLAALAALVPPIVLLAATHSATWLVRAHSSGWVYWVSLALTSALAIGSFALSFDALRSFAMMAGIRESMSWIWPAVIDIAIAHATVCLLSLSRPTPRRVAQPVESGSATAVLGTAIEHCADGTITGVIKGVQSVQMRAPTEPASPPMSQAVTMAAGTTPRLVFGSDSSVPDAADDGPDAEAPASTASAHQSSTSHSEQRPPECPWSAAADPEPAKSARLLPRAENVADRQEESDVFSDRWQPVAESLVRDGITTKDPDLIVKILADNAAGTPPTTIGRRHEIHHTTVSRIISAAEQQTLRSS